MSEEHPPIAEANSQPSNGCPVAGGRLNYPVEGGNANREWWPTQLNLQILKKNPPAANPLGEDFDYAKAVQTIDVDQLKADVAKGWTRRRRRRHAAVRTAEQLAR